MFCDDQMWQFGILWVFVCVIGILVPKKMASVCQNLRLVANKLLKSSPFANWIFRWSFSEWWQQCWVEFHEHWPFLGLFFGPLPFCVSFATLERGYELLWIHLSKKKAGGYHLAKRKQSHALATTEKYAKLEWTKNNSFFGRSSRKKHSCISEIHKLGHQGCPSFSHQGNFCLCPPRSLKQACSGELKGK